MEINATLIGQMITFAIFIGFTMKYVWPPLNKALEERQQKVAEGLEAANRGEKSLELARNKSAELLVAAKQQSAQVIEQSNARADRIVDEAKNRGKEEHARLIAQAKSEINREAEQAKDTLKKESVQLAFAAAEKILSQQIDRDAHDRLIDDLIREL